MAKGNFGEWIIRVLTAQPDPGFEPKATARNDDVQKLRQDVEDMRADIKGKIDALAQRVEQLELKVSNA